MKPQSAALSGWQALKRGGAPEEGVQLTQGLQEWKEQPPQMGPPLHGAPLLILDLHIPF